MWTLKLAFINIGRCMCALGWDRKGRMQYSNLGNWTMSVYTGIITCMTDVQNGTASAGWANGSLFLGYFKSETLGAPLAGRLASSPWHASSEGYFVLIIYQTFFFSPITTPVLYVPISEGRCFCRSGNESTRGSTPEKKKSKLLGCRDANPMARVHCSAHF